MAYNPSKTPRRDALREDVQQACRDVRQKEKHQVLAWIDAMPAKEWNELWPAFRKLMRAD